MQKKHLNLSCAGWLLLVLFFLLPTQTVQAQDKRIVVYYPEWAIYAGHNNYYPAHVPFPLITHLNYAFLEIVKNGTGNFSLRVIDSWASLEIAYGTWDQTGRMGNIRDLKFQRDAKNPGAKLMFSVGGWSRCGYFSEMAYTAAGRSSFAASCVNFLRIYGYDGIDIDWEYPGVARAPSGSPPGDQGNPVYGSGADDKANFTYLLRDVRQALDSAGSQDGKYYALTIAASCGYDKIGLTAPDQYHRYVDFINVMTYDIHGGWDTVTNHQSALYANPADPSPVAPVNVKERYNSDYAMQYFRNTFGVPAGKLIMGIPYYSRGWTGVNAGGTNGLFASASGSPSSGLWDGSVAPYYQTRGWAQGNGGFTRYYDNAAQVPWLYSASAREMWTYEDTASVQNKCDYVKSSGFGGVIVWDITGDYPNTAGGEKGYELTQAVYNRLMTGTQPTVVPTVSPAKTPTAAPTVQPTNPPGSCSYALWNKSAVYKTGNRVHWNSRDWEAKWWTTGEEPGTTGQWGVWKDLGTCGTVPTAPPATPTPAPTASLRPTATPAPQPTRTPTPPPGTAPAWAAYTAYAVGDRVTYNGSTYSCRQAHTSLPGWEPPAVQALWLQV